MFYKFVRFFGRFIVKILFFLGVHGDVNIPQKGGAILCANHRSFWDAVFIAVALKRPLAFIGKEELFKNKLFSLVLHHLHCYPVKRGGGDIAVVKTALKLLKQGELLVIFPEGQRIKPGMKPELKPGAFRLAAMMGVPIVPIGIRGEIRAFHKMSIEVGEATLTEVYKGERLSEEVYVKETEKLMHHVYKLAGTEHLI